MTATECEVCGENPGLYKCRLCGRIVCRECYDINNKLCIICKEALCEVCGKNLSIDACVMCGRRICRECMVEIDYARRVCIECYKRYKDELMSKYMKVVREVKATLEEVDQM